MPDDVTTNGISNGVSSEKSGDHEDTLTNDPQTWKSSSLVSVIQVAPTGLELLFRRTREIMEGCGVGSSRGSSSSSSSSSSSRSSPRKRRDTLQNKVVATVFYEASTRTRCSFEAATLRLGGKTLNVDASGGGKGSSVSKGETLEDSLVTIGQYVDAIVLRHPSKGSAALAARVCTVPLISGGDGTGEHPTQALLDLFTIMDELKLNDSSGASSKEDDALPLSKRPRKEIVVVLAGDLKHGRTVHSLARLLARWAFGSGQSVSLHYCAPPSLRMPDDVRADVTKFASTAAVGQTDHTSLEEAVDGADVLYMTRIQKERFDDPVDYDKVKDSYVVDRAFLSRPTTPTQLVVMHPLPRVGEIHPEVDDDPRAAYFRQVRNGMYVRMALLDLIVGESDDDKKQTTPAANEV